jgi:ATP-dependent DNA ligase
VVLPDGTTSFHALQNAMEAGSRERLAYFAFDLLHLDGYDLTGASLERKTACRICCAGPVRPPSLRYSDHVAGTGRQFFAQAAR